MSAESKRRRVLGLLLLLLGAINLFSSYAKKPVGTLQAIAHYGVVASMLAIGLWFLLRKPGDRHHA